MRTLFIGGIFGYSFRLVLVMSVLGSVWCAYASVKVLVI